MLGQIERGETNPSVGTLAKLAAALRCTLEDLVVYHEDGGIHLVRELETKPTRLNGGKVVPTVPEAVNCATGVVVNGTGVFDANGMALTFGTLSGDGLYTNGTVTVTDAVEPTGTSLAVDPTTGLYLILLSNRVHPPRENLARGQHHAVLPSFLLAGGGGQIALCRDAGGRSLCAQEAEAQQKGKGSAAGSHGKEEKKIKVLHKYEEYA